MPHRMQPTGIVIKLIKRLTCNADNVSSNLMLAHANSTRFRIRIYGMHTTWMCCLTSFRPPAIWRWWDNHTPKSLVVHGNTLQKFPSKICLPQLAVGRAAVKDIQVSLGGSLYRKNENFRCAHLYSHFTLFKIVQIN